MERRRHGVSRKINIPDMRMVLENDFNVAIDKWNRVESNIYKNP